MALPKLSVEKISDTIEVAAQKKGWRNRIFSPDFNLNGSNVREETTSKSKFAGNPFKLVTKKFDLPDSIDYEGMNCRVPKQLYFFDISDTGDVKAKLSIMNISRSIQAFRIGCGSPKPNSYQLSQRAGKINPKSECVVQVITKADLVHEDYLLVETIQTSSNVKSTITDILKLFEVTPSRLIQKLYVEKLLLIYEKPKVWTSYVAEIPSTSTSTLSNSSSCQLAEIPASPSYRRLILECKEREISQAIELMKKDSGQNLRMSFIWPIVIGIAGCLIAGSTCAYVLWY